jgi:hypothetical protein
MPVYTQPLVGPYTLQVNVPFTFTVSVEDPEGDPMIVTWDFGDGTPNATNTSTGAGVKVFTQEHTYTSLALPPSGLTITVNASDYNPSNNAIISATVYVTQPNNPPSVSSGLTMDPPFRAYLDQWTNWSVGAADSEDTDITFTWAWDDGTFNVTTLSQSAPGAGIVSSVMHKWAFTATYNVEVFADDGTGLPGHNVSLAALQYDVVLNAPPDTPSISPISGIEGLWTDCIASSSDLDGDGLTFTWDWGNGTYNVTHEVGTGLLTSSVKNMWATPGNYAVTVYVDDGRIEPGHNVSASTVAAVSPAGTELRPGSLSLVPRPSKVYVDTEVTFNASAVDVNGDAITFDIEFGDGGTATASSNGASASRQYALPEFTHSYTATGTYTVNLTASDAVGPSAPLAITVDVSENEPPYLVLAERAAGSYNRTLTLIPSLVLDNDTDVLNVWYDWDDGNESAGSVTHEGQHIYLSIGNFNVTVWVNDNTGLPGHNVSKNLTVTINENQRPSIVGAISKSPDKAEYEPGETVTFTIVINDYENDTVNITVDFDDGSDLLVLTFNPGPNVNVTKTFSHAFNESRSTSYHVVATVDDGMIQYHFVKSWYSQSADVNVPVKKSNTLLYVGLIVLAAVVVLVVLMLLLRRKKGAKPEETGGMEGMKPPEEPPPST